MHKEDEELCNLVKSVADVLSGVEMDLTTAESCTGGWVAKVLTDVPGSSLYFDRGFVTYSNQSKHEMLGVAEETLLLHGAVSEAIVSEMAKGALELSTASMSLAVSGIAGPTGGTENKPVGTVCFAWMIRGDVPVSETIYYDGDRDEIRRQAVVHCLEGVLKQINQ
ncbi:MAG: nicotinamide-nucleotide amidohydrolase family protein [Cocleimonas sp.]|nr:nicotinamide-nucleotide amidohydrolase family protein [Cocleimonas sp.]